MGKLLQLGLFLLCIEIVLALQCNQCDNYLDGKCMHEMQTCTAKDGDSCVTRRIYSWPYSVTNPQYAQTLCARDCHYIEAVSWYNTELTTCCKSYDFCNDPFKPIIKP